MRFTDRTIQLRDSWDGHRRNFIAQDKYGDAGGKLFTIFHPNPPGYHLLLRQRPHPSMAGVSAAAQAPCETRRDGTGARRPLEPPEVPSGGTRPGRPPHLEGRGQGWRGEHGVGRIL